VYSDDDNADIRPLLADTPGSFDTANTRHIDIHQDDIDILVMLPALLYCRLTTVYLCNNLDTLLGREQAGESVSDQVMVIDNHDADV
jgi:hypothetical protein